MTARDFSNQRLRWVRIFGVAGVGVILFGILLFGIFDIEAGIGLVIVGMLVTFPVSLVSHLLLFRCPWCRGNWAPLIAQGGFLRTVNPRFHFCPYCGHDIDQEVVQ